MPRLNLTWTQDQPAVSGACVTGAHGDCRGACAGVVCGCACHNREREPHAGRAPAAVSWSAPGTTTRSAR